MLKRLLILLIITLAMFGGCLSNDKTASSSQVPSSQSESPVNETYAPGEANGSAPAVDRENDEPLSPTLKIVVPEGYTLARIGMMLEENGICSAAEFTESAQNNDFSAYPLIAQQVPSPNRCFSLEGYLFPDTYEIYRSETPLQIIRRMLEQTERQISDTLREQIAISGYTTDEIITIASIIEKEAFGDDVMPLISSVIHNRLNIGMRLQCDVTITYVMGAIQPFIYGDKARFNDYYNTYTCPALPAGAICNPGLTAIQAALNPTQTDYYYFVTNEAKEYLFAESWEKHEQNVIDSGIPTE